MKVVKILKYIERINIHNRSIKYIKFIVYHIWILESKKIKQVLSLSKQVSRNGCRGRLTAATEEKISWINSSLHLECT